MFSRLFGKTKVIRIIIKKGNHSETISANVGIYFHE